MNRLQRLAVWLFRVPVPTLDFWHRVPSLRWVWTGRLFDGRKLGPDFLDGMREGLQAAPYRTVTRPLAPVPAFDRIAETAMAASEALDNVVDQSVTGPIDFAAIERAAAAVKDFHREIEAICLPVPLVAVGIEREPRSGRDHW